jgi:catechol 2,3-dioxygenase-like lactoylglutathione lyase family enzyme
MNVALTKDSIDLGIVVTDADAALGFYRDVLGLEVTSEMPMPDGGVVYRLLCGSSEVKLIKRTVSPPATSPPGGIAGSTGFRYFTISVSNIEEVTDACAAAGHTVVWPVRTSVSGATMSMVEDPDGNWVEFLKSD